MSEKTDKKKAASGQRLHEQHSSTEMFRDFLARSFYGILVIDHHGIIRFANQAAATIFGCSIEQFLGERCEFPLVTDKTTELTVKSRDGRTVALEMRGMATAWDGKQATVVHLQDITERRQKEQELRKIYRAVLEIPSIVMITDASGNIEFVNPRFTEVTGYTFAESVGRNPRFLQSGQAPPEVYRELWETIRAGREWRG
ncbi:MAG TPA: PAS domain S-box protein, partial [Geobacteraceae bacterium]|nr:PAS domain S-box protein [Geobacteraceae bacterium]